MPVVCTLYGYQDGALNHMSGTRLKTSEDKTAVQNLSSIYFKIDFIARVLKLANFKTLTPSTSSLGPLADGVQLLTQEHSVKTCPVSPPPVLRGLHAQGDTLQAHGVAHIPVGEGGRGGVRPPLVHPVVGVGGPEPVLFSIRHIFGN